jgi:thiamine kinase-like enzyme
MPTSIAATTLTHNDLHAENVLVDGERVVFVDWQNATRSTPMLDVANLIGGCVRPDVQRARWRSLLAHYEEALQGAGGPRIPDVVEQYATTTGLLFGWMMRYLASVSDDEAAGRSMLLVHWERVCTGALLPR